MLIGDYVEINSEHTEEELKKARAEVVEKICEALRTFANETPEEVFIEKEFTHPTDGSRKVKTIGCKVEIIV